MQSTCSRLLPVLLAVSGSLVVAAGGAERPNILWISTEDISPDLGCYGDPEARTPNLDRLAAEGVRFTRAFSISGVCAPSRSAIITGMYPTTIGTHHMRCKGVPPAYVKCFTEYLRAAGYYCTNNIKTDYNFDRPTTAWDENSREAYWRDCPEGRPFFSVVNITVTHESRIRTSPGDFARLTRNVRPEDRHDPARANLPPYYPDTPIVRRDWARYYDLITAMDLHVQMILDALEADGLADNTLVFFFGDHGRGLPRAKRWIYDSGLHIPLIIRWPGHLKPGTVNENLVSFIDFAPTLLSVAGVKIPKYIQGRAFLGPAAAPPRDYIFAARDRMDEAYDTIRAVRDKRYKYIRNFQPGKPYAQHIAYMEEMPTMREMRWQHKRRKLKGPQEIYFLPEKPEEELYDTQADPHEVKNLAGDAKHADALKRMRARLDKWQEETGDLGLTPEAELWERMRPGGKWAVAAEPVITPAEGAHDKPVSVTITCPTEGASIAYTIDKGKRPHWRLYTGPFRLTESTTVQAKACRLGYKDSPAVSAEIRIGPSDGG